MTAENRITDLEFRLDDYHKWLAHAINERDRLSLDAAWGVHHSLHFHIWVLVEVAAFLTAIKLLSGPTLIITCIAILIVMRFVQGRIHLWSNGERMKEVDSLSKLPEWKCKG